MKGSSSIRRAGVAATVIALVGMLAGATSASAIVFSTYDLFAGQDTDIGDVHVWNDATYYYLDIHISSDWCITESQVIAATAVTAIPQSNGNPVPGQFPVKQKYGACIDHAWFRFPVAGLGTDPYFAVHVKAWEKVTSSAVIVSNAGDSIAVASTYPSFGAAGPAAVASYAGWPAISGASYISNTAAGDPFNVNMWRRVTETLSVPGWPVGGELWVNSDNYEFTKLNGTEIQRDQDAAPATVEGTAPEPAGVSPQTWQTIEHVGFMPKSGTNTFTFVFRNSTWAGAPGFTDNPTGLAYKARVCYYAHSETAWAGTLDFPGSNWATYLQYHFNPVV